MRTRESGTGVIPHGTSDPFARSSGTQTKSTEGRSGESRAWVARAEASAEKTVPSQVANFLQKEQPHNERHKLEPLHTWL